jgi:alkylation response protein AidB-like acyl-CoA dehydrogenase
MRFAFSDEQLAFRDAARDVLEQHSSPAALRAAWASPGGRTAGAWTALYEMGVLAALVPEADGGLGLTDVDVVLVLEESGRFALAEPLMETMLIGAPLLAVRDTESASVTIPEAPFAPWADTAAAIVDLAVDGARIVPGNECALVPYESVDGARRLSDVSFSDRPPTLGLDAVIVSFRRGVLGTAAQLCGLADRMISLTVEYVKERRQFGVPVGSFQAVKHHLADARTQLEFARPLTYRAAASIAGNDPDASLHVSMAKAYASDAATLAARVALQCHGAIGYTTECDLHLYMKRAWALAAAWGDADWHRFRVEESLFDDADEYGENYDEYYDEFEEGLD